MLSIKNLTKYYGEFRALNDLSFTIERGRILGFLGPNGAGKTTTMRIVTGFMPPTSGSVLVDGMDLAANSARIKKFIGYLPETPPLYPDMRVNEYLTYIAEIKGVDRTKIPERLAVVKEQCGLHEVAHKLNSALSKGYRQRVGIAQSLINDPELLVLDEPTIGLDPKQISDIRSVIRAQAGERTVIISTHILSEVALICDDILIINRGKMMFFDSLQNIGTSANLEQLFLKYTYATEQPAIPEGNPV